MKIVYLGEFRRHYATEVYIQRALARAGCDVHCLNEKTLLAPQIFEYLAAEKPDLLLFSKGKIGGFEEMPPADMVSFIGQCRRWCRSIASWTFDLLAESFSPERWTWASAVASACDFFFTTDGHSAPLLRQQFGANAIVLRQGVPDDYREQPAGEWRKELACDVLFLGHPYGERIDEIKPLATHFGERFRCENNTRGPALLDLMASAKVVVGPVYPSYSAYWSNRLYVVTGYGGCFAGPQVEGMRDDGWKANEHYFATHFRRPDKCGGGMATVGHSLVDRLEELLADDHLREKIRAAGMKNCRKFHTYDHRVADLLRIVSAERKN